MSLARFTPGGMLPRSSLNPSRLSQSRRGADLASTPDAGWSRRGLHVRQGTDPTTPLHRLERTACRNLSCTGGDVTLSSMSRRLCSVNKLSGTCKPCCNVFP